MRYLNKITTAAFQEFALTGNPGQRIIVKLRFLPSQNQWMADIEWNDFILRGIVLTQSPNLLRAYKNLIPFGICCQTIDGIDPYFIDDFSNQRARLYLLTADEVNEIEQGLFE